MKTAFLKAMFHLVYVSSSTRVFNSSELVSLLEQSRKNNAGLDITGILLHHDGNFLQVLEGEKATVLALFDKIRRDERHQGVISVLQEALAEREFPDWSMAFRNLKNDEVNGLEGFSSFLQTPLHHEELSGHPGQVRALLKVFKAGAR